MQSSLLNPYLGPQASQGPPSIGRVHLSTLWNQQLKESHLCLAVILSLSSISFDITHLFLYLFCFIIQWLYHSITWSQGVVHFGGVTVFHAFLLAPKPIGVSFATSVHKPFAHLQVLVEPPPLIKGLTTLILMLMLMLMLMVMLILMSMLMLRRRLKSDLHLMTPTRPNWAR